MPGPVQAAIRRLASDASRLADAIADFRRAHRSAPLDLGLGYLRAAQPIAGPGRLAVYELAVAEHGARSRRVTLTLQARSPGSVRSPAEVYTRLALSLCTKTARRHLVRVETDHRDWARATVDGAAVAVQASFAGGARSGAVAPRGAGDGFVQDGRSPTLRAPSSSAGGGKRLAVALEAILDIGGDTVDRVIAHQWWDAAP